MNIELAKQVLAAAIHSHAGLKVEGLPEFYMGSWVEHDELNESEEDFPRVPLEQLKEGDCGTSACLAGYVTLLRAPAGTTTDGEDLFDFDGNNFGDFARFATQELDLPPTVASCLFYTGNATAISRLRRLIAHPDTTPEMLLRINVKEREGE